jgi:hypothetical protein
VDFISFGNEDRLWAWGGGVSKIGPKLIKNYPVWNNELNGYYGAITGKPIPTSVGIFFDLIPPVAGTFIPPLFEGNK